ncbi:MAG: hypothetical protein ABI273_09305 [Lacunisphaera sp.]
MKAGNIGARGAIVQQCVGMRELNRQILDFILRMKTPAIDQPLSRSVIGRRTFKPRHKRTHPRDYAERVKGDPFTVFTEPVLQRSNLQAGRNIGFQTKSASRGGW